MALAGKSGYAGLVHNRRVFAIAIFASLGGLLYGAFSYNQGVFSGVLAMHSFDVRMKDAVDDAGKKGWLVAILELGAWVGVLATGYLADKLSRKYTIVLAVVVFCIGVVVQTAAFNPDPIFAGRFITGLGVGSLSMAVPLYNAEIAPPEVRGSLVGLQQLAITFGIMISFWIDYGTNFIGGTREGQLEAAWRIPLGLQLIPAVILGVGILFMPFSPRWLVNQGRDEEALAILSQARNLPPDSELVRIEFLEIKAQYLFEKETAEINFPQYQDGSFSSNFKLGFYDYLSLMKSRTGINAILYYAPSIFKELSLTDNSVSLLATGVVGIAMFIATIPAILWVDQLGRKPVLISGAFLMAACHFIVAILSGLYRDSWAGHSAAGWAACVLVWLFAVEKLRTDVYAKMNNFIVGQVTPSMLEHITYGTFIFFGAFSLAGGLFIWWFVPETKGLTLEEMDIVFGATEGLAAADQVRQEAILRRLGLIDDGVVEKKSDEETGSRNASQEHDEKVETTA
ncbi:hypothetical protein EST38_g4122 [Candolleomyces aberdarensis]|uniref:Major facilitator superfamily (MFS) profile domain-containing protein n=1 Tax=Candolleomyces aberdarensis TaxID=2316362 RepID=A0A4Q2DS44_9AGAR|nr:hypothetical protein EST38_g4122 [Candolleomyces aberdarensis]